MNKPLRQLIFLGVLFIAAYLLFKPSEAPRSANVVKKKPVDEPPVPQSVGGGEPDPDPEPEPVIPENPANPENIFVPYTLSTQLNHINLNQFEDYEMPSAIRAVAGFGWPTYSTESTTPKLKTLRIGFSNVGNPDVYMPPIIPNSAQHQFVDGTQRVKGLASQLYNSTGGASGPYADAINIIGDSNNTWMVSDETAEAMGELWSWTGIDHSGQFTRSFNGATVLIDDENLPFSVRLIGGVAKGARKNYLNDSFSYVLYGRVIHYFSLRYKNDASMWDYPNTPTDAEIVSFRTKESSPWNYPSVKESKMTLDCGAYFKNMILHTRSKYQRSGDPDTGALLLDGNGKRQFRLGDITETQYGRVQTLRAEPRFEQKYLQYNPTTGAQLWNTELQPGYYWNGWMGNPYLVTKWWSGVELSIRQQYEFVDRLLIGRLNIQDMNKGNFDINTYDPTSYIKPGCVVRLETEYWTALGNEIVTHNISESGIKLLSVYPLMCGIRHLESWGNGWGGIGLQRIDGEKQQTKPEGQKLYPTESGWYGQTGNYVLGDDNHSRHEVFGAAVNSVAKWMQGVTFNTTLKYIIFNTPIWSYRNFELFSTGTYQGTTLKITFYYCMNDMVDNTAIVLKAGASTFNLTLHGDEYLCLSLNVPAGLSPADFTIQYTTVYGKNIHKNGLCTGNKVDQYLT